MHVLHPGESYSTLVCFISLKNQFTIPIGSACSPRSTVAFQPHFPDKTMDSLIHGATPHLWGWLHTCSWHSTETWSTYRCAGMLFVQRPHVFMPASLILILSQVGPPYYIFFFCISPPFLQSTLLFVWSCAWYPLRSPCSQPSLKPVPLSVVPFWGRLVRNCLYYLPLLRPSYFPSLWDLPEDRDQVLHDIAECLRVPRTLEGLKYVKI